MGKQSPPGFSSQTVQFQGKMFTFSFLQAAVAGPILGIDFLGKLKITVATEISQILFACTAAPLPAKPFFLVLLSLSAATPAPLGPPDSSPPPAPPG
jgi:hypothetical protein